MKVRAHIFVSGRVQGVFFRVETRDEATKRNVTGWVRNTSDGRVEAIFEGNREDVEKMIEFCKHGPPGARVTKIDVHWKEYTGEFNEFKIRRTEIF
ncbi:MAG TPA: acylphosphatase [Candidatus Bathyarchaeota archaeon]|nr:acylphosphatase [Candidatus Bathyarchaeota archaeon]